MTGDLTADRGLGQNFLKDPAVLDRSVRAAADLVADPAGAAVLEVGPGTGQLTAALLGRGFSVTAIEADPRMEAVLGARFRENGAFRLVMGDARALRFGALVPDDRPVLGVSNLPYYLTTPLITQYLTQLPEAAGFVWMVQEDVVSRLRPDPSGRTTLKRRGPLMVLGECFGSVDVVRKVGAGSFDPPPRIGSALVRYRPHPQGAEERALWTETAGTMAPYLARAFTQRRRTLGNNLRMALEAEGVADPAAGLERVFAADPEARGIRPESLACVRHMRLCRALAGWLASAGSGAEADAGVTAREG